MADKNLYVLAGYDDATEAKLSGIQNKLYELGFSGEQTRNIPMHFTLGCFGTEREEELKERLVRLSKKVKQFPVEFHHLGLFNLPGKDVLFVSPEVSDEMVKLRDFFSDNKDEFPWEAHTTILIDKPEVINEAKAVVLHEFQAFDGEVTTLYLYEFFPARHILTVQLCR